ncbi:hypothetical protein GCM10020295_07130 [Streptomyces cinereospinus]
MTRRKLHPPGVAGSAGGPGLVRLEGDAHQAQQQVDVRVAVEVDGHPPGAGHQPDRRGDAEVLGDPADGPAGQVQVHVAGRVEVGYLAAGGANCPPRAATGRSRREVGPDCESLQGALGQSHVSIVTASPHRYQWLNIS